MNWALIAQDALFFMGGACMASAFWWQARDRAPNLGVTVATIQNAFHEGRRSTTGTDRHRPDDAWLNSKARRRALEILDQ
jgi:hypothetical protein